MKLTKDDFAELKDGRVWIDKTITKQERDQILKNQEDAEKYRNQPEIVTLTLKYREIVERLKKRIKECDYNKDYNVFETDLQKELQKIIGEGNA